MLGQDFEDEVWSRFVFELVIWPNRLLWKDELNPRVRCAFGNVSVVTFLRAGNRKQWTNSLSKQGVWRIRPAFALHLNQDSHEAILYSKSRGRWARQRPRWIVRGSDEGGWRGLGRDHGRGEGSIDNILSRVTFLCLRVQHHHHRHQNLLQGWLSILLLS